MTVKRRIHLHSAPSPYDQPIITTKDDFEESSPQALCSLQSHYVYTSLGRWRDLSALRLFSMSAVAVFVWGIKQRAARDESN